MPPGTLPQLVILILFVIPGSVYQATRAWLVGELPQDADMSRRLLRAITASAALHALYLVAFGTRLVTAITPPDNKNVLSGVAAHPRRDGLLGLVLLVVVPSLAAWALIRRHAIEARALRGALWLLRADAKPDPVDGYVRRRVEARLKVLRAAEPTPRLVRAPSAWDWASDKVWAQAGFVRVLIDGTRWVGGAYGGRSYISAYPEPPAIFVERGWELDANGRFIRVQDQTRGLWVSCENATVVEFVGPADQEETR
jgi:hypothetical protein